MTGTDSGPNEGQPGEKRFYLTSNNGSHAVAMTEYTSGYETKVWTSILTQRWNPDWDPNNLWHLGNARAFEYEDIGANWRHWAPSDSWPFKAPDDSAFFAVDCHVANNALYKSYTWRNQHSYGNDIYPDARAADGTSFPSLIYQNGGSEDFWWPSHPFTLESWDSLTTGNAVAIALFRGPDSNARTHGCVVFSEWDHSYSSGHGIVLACALTTNGGRRWDKNALPIKVGDDRHVSLSGPTLATDDTNGGMVYLAFNSRDLDSGPSRVLFTKSTDWGLDWGNDDTLLGYGLRPCIAAVGQFVFVCWSSSGSNSRIKYRYSTNGGDVWQPSLASDPAEVPFEGHANWEFEMPNVAAVPCPTADYRGVLIVARLRILDHSDAEPCTIRGWFLRFHDGTCDYSKGLMPLCAQFDRGNPSLQHPSIAAVKCSEGIAPGSPIACCVVSTPPYRTSGPVDRRNIRQSQGYWANRGPGLPSGMNTARLLAKVADGAMHYAGATWPYFAAGEVIDGWPAYCMAGTGDAPALAVDGGGWRWVAYVDMDTLWVWDGENEPSMVFAGSSSAVPGQPSIVCYPNQANGVYVGNVVFAVCDTAGGTSMVLYCRVDTGQVVLDTIESVSGLGDSLPCINVYKTDSLICTWQHSGAVYSALLPDYGPGTTSRPGPWSSPNVVTADGYHPMSVFDGSVLNCVYSDKDGDDFAVRRATNDLSNNMFSGWTAQNDPSGDEEIEKANPVYAGVGVSVWQQMASGKWVVKGKVRGEEMTLVSDSVAVYHPHAVAESSAASPSIDQLRVYLLYTAGVTFEVDSGVTDTGETRFYACSLNVSHAGACATASNAGSKLLRKSGSDSLLCLYADEQGAVWYAWSAAGDSWKRDQMAADRDYPALAEDSSGRRWAVLRGVEEGSSAGMIEAYFRSNSAWSEPLAIFTADPGKTVGPPALAGASRTSGGIAYAVFKVEGQEQTYTIKVAKFDGSNLDTCTIASGSSLGDPSITVEPVCQDSDRIHVTWSDNGEVKCRTCMDSRSAEITGTWTSAVNLSGTQATSVHPFIAADREQVVVAWAEGDTADIFCCKRSTDSAYNNWEDAANLSNTASKHSDYPTVAMGDTVVVAWEEHRSTTDYDILACIDFDDTLNIADNATVSSYPHVLFQNKTSGDTAIPYLHAVWSEAPEANVYEVGYNKLNLKQASGGGQLSAGPAPLPGKPSLSACRPNPFRDRTQIAYQLPTAGNVRLEVFDVTGRTVRTLASGHKAAGSYTVNWDARDNRGREVPRGVYFYRLDTPGFRAVRKVVLAR